LWDWYICGLNSPALYQLSYRGINLVLACKKTALRGYLKSQTLVILQDLHCSKKYSLPSQLQRCIAKNNASPIMSFNPFWFPDKSEGVAHKIYVLIGWKDMKISRVIGLFLLIVVMYLWLGLPLSLRMLGLHPVYQGQKFTLPGKKALIITTSHSTLGEGGKPTGVFGSELTAPYYAFIEGGMQVDIASIQGGVIPIEPISFRWFIASESDKRYLDDGAFQHKVKHSLKIDAIDFTQFEIIFLAGGWGAAYDLGTSKVLGQKISQAWAAQKTLGGVCHGPLGLLLALDTNGNPLLQGKHVTAVTDRQVMQLGVELTPQHPERELRKAGALFENANAFLDIFANHSVVDGNLVTGQNQNAGPQVAQEMMRISGGLKR
jgi:putative intracellular protease/amidase